MKILSHIITSLSIVVVALSSKAQTHSDWFTMSVNNQLNEFRFSRPFEDVLRVQNTSFQIGFEREFNNSLSFGALVKMGKVNDFRSDLVDLENTSFSRATLFGLQAHGIKRFYSNSSLNSPNRFIPFVLGGISINGIQAAVANQSGGFDLQIPLHFGVETTINPVLSARLTAGIEISSKLPHRSFSIGFRYALQNEGDPDGDGIPNDRDMCPNVPGLGSNFGCPDQDMDNDGTPDYLDDCPMVSGSINGCPDTDRDLVADHLDECPTVFGSINGCPDQDGDLIADHVDECPKVAGLSNGCPVEPEIDSTLLKKHLAQASSDEAVHTNPFQVEQFPNFVMTDLLGLKQITKGKRADGIVYFEPNSKQIRHNEKRILMLVSAILNKNPHAEIVIIGYTDRIGNPADNLVLSEQRARAVADMLIEDGVQSSQIKLVGMGEAMNGVGLEDNHAFHRRVEVYFRYN